HKIPYAVSYRKIKYPRIELKTGKVLLIIPFGKKPDAILEKHEQWIHRKLDFIGKCLKASSGKKLADRADTEFRELINRIADEVSRQLRVRLKGISFRKMRTKWASLSSKKNITVNTLMRHLPVRLIRYIVYHEMVHLIEKRHNENFWKIISKHYRNHSSIEREMFAYWFLINKKESRLS
ncbi:MAG: hypothetical protein COS89_09915, partial [Deltaproteobacteria bacterium CG07_land_8_20_14_0_80_38_7]